MKVNTIEYWISKMSQFEWKEESAIERIWFTRKSGGFTRKSLLEGGFIFNSGFETFQKGELEKKGVKKIEGGVTLKD